MHLHHLRPELRNPQLYADFVLVGVSHHSAEVSVREQFALSKSAQQELLKRAKAQGLDDVLIVSTCNRTQVLARTPDRQRLIDLFVSVTETSSNLFGVHGEIKQGAEAVAHVFEIAAGLDSQILGDLQIVKQVKDGYELAQKHNLAGSFLHRLMSHVLKAHKRIRRETALGKGAASTAGAAVQFVLEQTGGLTNRNVLLIGTGKIGKVTCRNLASHNPRSLTLLNRSRDRAERLGSKFDVRVGDFANLSMEIAAADVVIVATGAQQPLIHPEHVHCPGAGHKILVDLSIPRNIDPAVDHINNVELCDIDDLSATSDKAYEERLAAVPHAREILLHELNQLDNWMETQKVAPTIKALQDRFEEIRSTELDAFRNKLPDSDYDKIEQLTQRIVKKIAAHSIEHLRKQPDHSDELAAMLHEMFKLKEN